VPQRFSCSYKSRIKSDSRVLESGVTALPQSRPPKRLCARHGRHNKKGTKMNSLTTRVLAAATVGALAVSLAAPSFAASRVK
jgi:hypothetical protein